MLSGLGFGDAAAPYRGKYSTREEAQRFMGRRGIEDAAEREFARLGWGEINRDAAHDVDVGVLGNSLAIHYQGRWWAKSETGAVAKRRVRRAWRPA